MKKNSVSKKQFQARRKSFYYTTSGLLCLSLLAFLISLLSIEASKSDDFSTTESEQLPIEPQSTAQFIYEAAQTPWQNFTPEQEQIFTDLFSDGKNTELIPPTFKSDSAFAYALGIGNIGPGALGSDGKVYKLKNDRWQELIPTNFSSSKQARETP